jgi:SlyX protein
VNAKAHGRKTASLAGANVESRLADIEMKLTFNEDLLEELNRTVYRQQLQIDQLQKELHAMREQIRKRPANPICT